MTAEGLEHLFVELRFHDQPVERCRLSIEIWYQPAKVRYNARRIGKQKGRTPMTFLGRVVRSALAWAAANPVKAAQLAVALAILGTTLATTKRVDRSALKRAVRVFL